MILALSSEQKRGIITLTYQLIDLADDTRTVHRGEIVAWILALKALLQAEDDRQAQEARLEVLRRDLDGGDVDGQDLTFLD